MTDPVLKKKIKLKQNRFMAWSDAADIIKFASHIFALKIDFDTIIKNFSVLKFQSVNSLHDNKSGGREEAPVGALVELLETEV